MGEVGFSRDQFLHGLKWWEIRAIIDGYRKRERTYLLMTRWSTWMIMCTGMADLRKAGLYSDTDLIRFTWEEEDLKTRGFTVEEMKEIDRMLGLKKKQ